MKWNQFKGLNNRLRQEEIPADVLSVARNVDLDDTGRLSRRDGFDDIATLTGNYHSLWSDGEICLSIKNNSLYKINTDKTETVLRPNVGNSDMSYVSVNGKQYYTNGTVIGYIDNGVSYTFSDPAKQYKIAPPPGQLIEYFNGRLYIAKGPVLWHTDAMAFGRVDTRKGFKQFASDITMILPVDGGLFVSDQETTYFVAGPSPEKATIKTVQKAGFNGVVIQGNKFNKEIQGTVAFFATEESICMGLSDGTVVPLTLEHYKLPGIKKGSFLIREENNRLQLISRLYN